MKTEFVPPTEIEKQRNAWFKQRAKPGMTFEDCIRLNDEALHLFPSTEEERRQKTENLIAMPEFVL
jgi:methionine aminopeptidase